MSKGKGQGEGKKKAKKGKIAAIVAVGLFFAPLLTVGGLAAREADRRAIAGLDLVGLADYGPRLPSELSGGQQQRVAVARALTTRPAVLFADEPTGNLDSRTGEEVLHLLRRSCDELGQTIVMVTHSPAHADYASRTVNMLDGRVLVETRRAA